MKRIYNNIKNHSNWLKYYIYKYFSSQTSFTFMCRGGLRINVPSRLLQTYKECFFDETYFKGLPKKMIPKTPQIVIDIGANVGYFSFFIFSINRGAKVFSYEPMPNNFELLKKYKTQNADLKFTIVNKAVSRKKETIILNYDSSDSYTTAATIFENKNQPDNIEVEATTMEDIITDNNLDKIDFLKLDCEGAEYSIVFGAPTSILEKISLISIETHKGKAENENINALAAFLRQHNFEINTYKNHIWGWKTITNKK